MPEQSTCNAMLKQNASKCEFQNDIVFSLSVWSNSKIIDFYAVKFSNVIWNTNTLYNLISDFVHKPNIWDAFLTLLIFMTVFYLIPSFMQWVFKTTKFILHYDNKNSNVHMNKKKYNKNVSENIKNQMT